MDEGVLLTAETTFCKYETVNPDDEDVLYVTFYTAEMKIINSVGNSVNQLQKGKQIKEKDLAQMRKEVVEQIKDKICGTDFENEEERIQFQQKMERKIKSGAKLSQKEMNYLRRYNPYMYQHMVRVQYKRESLKEQLKHCRTKEEAHRVISTAFSSISEEDPVREAMVAAVANVSEQYRSSDTYKKLPNASEDFKRLKHVEKAASDIFKQDEEEAEDGSEYVAVSYNFNSSGYQEAVTEVFISDNIFTIKA